ncbi:MAG: type IV pilin protein [Patescibacteria group bacterium]|jgi:prepilin-type N-terminal cleavage/methylation domain-containing protein
MLFKSFSRGFTLVELLISVTIVGILATIGSGAYTKSIKRARDGQAKSEVSEIHKALEMYYSINGKYPNTEEFPEELEGNDPSYFSGGTVPTSNTSDDDSNYNYHYAYDPTEKSYCLCTHRLEADPGNSEDFNCTFVDSGDLDDRPYFCMKSSQ